MTADVRADTGAPHSPLPRAPARYERQKHRILDAATLALNQKGVRGMTLQQVAASLDLGTSSVAYYFRRREQLAAAVFADSLDRLAAVAARAATEPTPRRRVAAYIDLYLEQVARGLRGEARPFANLSEIRSMEEGPRAALVARYQDVFRTVRSFFGAVDAPDRRRLLTARAHVLNEALFWSEAWVPRFAIADFPDVGRRMFDILDRGLVAGGATWSATSIPVVAPPDDPDRTAFLRAATRLVNDHGYKGASVERITRELNRAKTALYRHADGKDELVAACARESYHRFAALRQGACARGLSAWDQLLSTVWSALTLQFTGDFPLLRSSSFQAMPAPLRAVAVERSERTALGLTGLLVDAMREGRARIVDPVIAGNIILSSVDASYDMKGWIRRQRPDEALRSYTGVLFAGLSDD